MFFLSGFSHEKLLGLDTEKAYLSLNLDGTPEEKLAKATTLSRQELREQLSEDKFGEHEHIPDMTRASAPCTICGSWHRI